MKIKILLLIAICIFMASCKKDECPEPIKIDLKKCAGCKPIRKPVLEIK